MMKCAMDQRRVTRSAKVKFGRHGAGHRAFGSWFNMTAFEAFSAFVFRALSPVKAARYSGLAATAKGQRKLLGTLDHDFERAIRPDARRGVVIRNARCYAFHTSVGFGAEVRSVAEAYERLSGVDGWLIVLSDGSGGIYRPESHWDAAIEIVG